MVTQLFHLCPHGPAQWIVIQFPRVHSGALQLTSWLQEASVSRPCVVSFAWPGSILHHLLFVLHTGGQRKWRRRQRKMSQDSRGHEWQLAFSQESSCYCGWIVWKKTTTLLHRVSSFYRPNLVEYFACSRRNDGFLACVPIKIVKHRVHKHAHLSLSAHSSKLAYKSIETADIYERTSDKRSLWLHSK